MTTKPSTIFKYERLYLRVSTSGQSVAGQRRDVQNWLSGHKISDVKWYIDKATGEHLKRPSFERLQSDIFDGKVQSVVLWKLDRLSRSLIEGLNTLADWCEKGLRIVSVTQQLDFNGTVGKMIAAVLLGVAEMEQETRKERQAVGIAAAKERGVYTGRKRGTTKADPAKARTLVKMGLNHVEVATALNVSRRTVLRYLTNKVVKKNTCM